MFGFSIVKPPFSFTDIKTITIPAICSVLIVHNNPELFINLFCFILLLSICLISVPVPSPL